MSDLELLRDSYYDLIVKCTEFEEVVEMLPNNVYSNYEELMNGIIKKLKDRIAHLRLEMKNEDEEYQLLYIDEIKLLEMKLDACLFLLNEIHEDEKVTGKVQLIFSTRMNNSTYFENDLKDIPEEYYGKILELLKKLESGETTFNTSKSKFLTNNGNLNGVQEIKNFKLRIIYKNLGNNHLYIMMVKMKKSNDDTLDTRVIVERYGKTIDEFENLRKRLLVPRFQEQIDVHNQEVRDYIFSLLDRKKRI